VIRWRRTSGIAFACRVLSRHAFCAIVGLAAGGVGVEAQSATHTVEGRIRRPLGERGDSTGMGPAANVWVVLHRLAKDQSGPIDSVRSDAKGRYTFRYQPKPNEQATYFASVSYAGIAYFTPPFKTSAARGDDSELTVFDTTTRTFPLSVKGRHLIVGKRDTGQVRTIIEVFELSNDSLYTLVAANDRTPTWQARIPDVATNVRVNEGDVSAQAFASGNGRVQLFAPIPPGIKQLSFTYTVPQRSFPLAFTAEAGAVVFEILLEDPAASVQALGFTRVGEVTIEGRQFQRILSQDVKAGTRLAIDAPASSGPSGATLYRYAVFVVLGCVLLLLVGRAMQRSAQQRARQAANNPLARPTLHTLDEDAPTVERLEAEIAALNALYAKQHAPSESVTRAYEERKAELESAREVVLAGRSPKR
jgi:hypothetical protein